MDRNYAMCFFGWIFFILVASEDGVTAGKGVKRQHAPVLRTERGEPVYEYIGYVALDRLDSNRVAITPAIRASDGDLLDDKIGRKRQVCGYHIYPRDGEDGVPPFTVFLRDHLTGEAEMYTTREAKSDDYRFQIAAYDCSSPSVYSDRVSVSVTVMNSDIAYPPGERPGALKITIHQSDDEEEEADEGDGYGSGHEEFPIIEEAPDSNGTPLLQEGSVVHNRKRPIIPMNAKSKLTRVKSKVFKPSKDLRKAGNSGKKLKDAGKTVQAEDSSDKISGDEVSRAAVKPIFESPSYIAEMEEGTLYDSVMVVRAVSMVTKAPVDICLYKLMDPTVPFSIDKEGNLKNTRRLIFAREENFIIPVVAEDCDGGVSDPAYINIRIRKICIPQWKDTKDSVVYTGGSEPVHVFPTARLDSCSDPRRCENPKISAKLTLTPSRPAKACQKDTASILAQRSACGASHDETDLLTAAGEESSSQLFESNTDALSVTSPHVNHTLGDHFTLATWMRHSRPHTAHGTRENILCNSDGEGMNRHHYSLYIRNCHLVFLFRKESYEVADLGQFQPAEWRWQIPEVCDGSWHHYALSVDYPQVRLYVDGNQKRLDDGQMHVVDDWSLHPTPDITFTRLTVGACWHAKDSKFTQGFRGELAGLTLLRGRTESERLISCLNHCGEKILLSDRSALQEGMSMLYNDDMTELSLKGGDAASIQALVRQLVYLNTNINDVSEGEGHVRLTAVVMCEDIRVDVEPADVYISMETGHDPHITITGLREKSRTVDEMRQGVPLFSELEISNKALASDSGSTHNTLALDKCEVRTDRAFRGPEEGFHLPSFILDKYGLDTAEFDRGFDITGVQSYAGYQRILQQTVFHSLSPDARFDSLSLTVQCSYLNYKYSSNLYTLTLVAMDTAAADYVVHDDIIEEGHGVIDTDGGKEVIGAGRASIGPSLGSAAVLDEMGPQERKMAEARHKKGSPAAHAQVMTHGVAANQKMSLTEKKPMKSPSVSVSAGIVALITICVVIVVVVGTVALAKLRQSYLSHRAAGGCSRSSIRKGAAGVGGFEESEMEWDNSTLNIVVNPLDEQSEAIQSTLLTEAAEDGSDLDDDDEFEPDTNINMTLPMGRRLGNGTESGAEEGQLDWDHSNLSY